MPDSLFTLIAQILNFVIIVLVLRKLLFKRILGSVQARRQEIEEQRASADEEQQKAKKLRQELEEKHASFRKEREKLMQNASQEAAKRRKKLLEQAETEAEGKRDRWESSMQKERESFLTELRALAAEELIQVARRMLTDLADETFEKRIVERVGDRLQDDENEIVKELMKSEVVTVYSSFDLPDEMKETLKDQLPSVEFSRSDQFHGLAIEAEGRRIAWTVEGWLEDFGAELERRLSEYSGEVA